MRIAEVKSALGNLIAQGKTKRGDWDQSRGWRESVASILQLVFPDQTVAERFLQAAELAPGGHAVIKTVDAGLTYLQALLESAPALVSARETMQAQPAPAARPSHIEAGRPRAWHYRTVDTTDPRTSSLGSRLDAELNAHGEQGWEFVAVVPLAWLNKSQGNPDMAHMELYRLFFKRPVDRGL